MIDKKTDKTPANDNMHAELEAKYVSDFQEAEKIRIKLKSLKVKDDHHILQETHDDTQLANTADAAKGMAASMHVVSGVLVGGLIGYGIDYLLNSLPFATVIMIPIGMVAGFRNMIKSLDS